MTNPRPQDLENSMKFIPKYFWSFTLLKNVEYNTLYLACDTNRGAFMVPMNSTNYPDARALFIVNKYVPKLSV